ncbi:MAG: NTP transferase domain-containing protein [Chitinivibrionales bacterium]|nr:NTP transferase domain-containing protein [Chitinivibrionales bacterium]
MNIIPVILAGGIGERFWPLSRSSSPKQLLPLISDKPMIIETLQRVDDFCSAQQRPLIITGKKIASAISKVLPGNLSCEFIKEPVGKNTAPAVCLAAQWIIRKHSDAVMVVLSADHAISPKRSFVSAIKYAAGLAEQTDRLIVFGIPPSRPDTGYGYIRRGKPIGSKGNVQSCLVQKFVEKPSDKKAASYVKSGNYFWNSGMFVWKCSIILEEFQKYMPSVYALSEMAARSNFSQKAIDSFYHNVENESIDFGIMEHSRRVAMVTPRFSWDDVGSWESVARHNRSSAGGCTLVGDSIYESDISNSIIVNKSSMNLAAIGLDNIILVAVGDAVLAISRDKLPDLKKHLGKMKKNSSFSETLF